MKDARRNVSLLLSMLPTLKRISSMPVLCVVSVGMQLKGENSYLKQIGIGHL